MKRNNPSGELLLVVAIAVLVAALALLRLAVERESVAGQPERQPLSSARIGSSVDAVDSSLKAK